jgi:glycosyltransferase involved in cell wall biosynthesis
MRIIYVHQYFRSPDTWGSTRSYELASALADEGHQVEMICAWNEKHKSSRRTNNFQVHYLPVSYYNSMMFFRRLYSFFRFVVLAKRTLKTLAPFDLCFVSSTPLSVGQIGIYAKKKYKVPFILEIRDLWPDFPIQMLKIKNPLIIKFLHAFEKKIYKNSDGIIALSPGIQKAIKQRVPEKEIILIPNFSQTDFFNPKISPQKPEKLKIIYFGSTGRANDLPSFLHLAEKALERKRDIEFCILGSGSEFSGIEKSIRIKKLSNIKIQEVLPKKELAAFLEAYHFSYISFAPLPVLELCSPNKFFDSMAMGLVCMINIKGWLKDLVEEHSCGFYADPGNPEKVLEILSRYEEHPEILYAERMNARKAAEKEFCHHYRKKEFCRIIDEKKEK